MEDIDILAIDMNGLFHMCAQRIYNYGNSSAHMLYHSKIHLLPKTNLTLFRDVCEKIENLRNLIKPKKQIILCVDGVAGLGKMNQQRQRRYKTSIHKSNYFNPNCFTPGTKTMDHLTKYIDWYIRSMITLNPEWQHLEILLSNEKVPGEGEHKIMHYLKKYVNHSEKICIYGLDADLMMLGILLPHENVLIAREPEQGFIEYITIKLFRSELLKIMKWERDYVDEDEPIFDKNHALNDFILLSFLVGNDFLPTLPTLTILDGAIDTILQIYRDNGKIFGHLTDNIADNIIFNIGSLANFSQLLGKQEKILVEKKYNSQIPFFPDPLVIKNMKLVDQRHEVNMAGYKVSFYEKKFPPNTPISSIVKEYLDGMLWIINYYKIGMPDWLWHYPYFYGPFIEDFYNVLKNDYQHPEFSLHEPLSSFLQLLMVLPPSSKDLLPEPLDTLMDKDGKLGYFYPTVFEIDLTGKKKDWEGIVILPLIDVEAIRKEYYAYEKFISNSEKKRNIVGKNFYYRYDANKNDMFSSFYGNIQECPVSVHLF